MKLLFLAAVLCIAPAFSLAQTNSSVDQNTITKPGEDDFGRPVQPVGTPVQQVQPVPAADQESFEQNMKDIYFDFNRAELDAEDKAALRQNADWLKAHPGLTFTIEGDADPRGSIPYNLFLSDERALAAREELVKLGVPEKQILFATGWGELYPVCNQDDESCWSKQRRVHFAPWTAGEGPTTSAEANPNPGVMAADSPGQSR